MPGAFNRDDYIDVQQRINRFWQEHADGAINTRIVAGDFEHVVIEASVYKHREDMRASATGIAAETKGTTTKDGANLTSWHENGETSAIGRALANMGYATSSKDRPSRQEIDRVNRGSAAVKRQEAPGATNGAANVVRTTVTGGGAQGDERTKQLRRLEKLVADRGDDHSGVHALMSLKGYASVKDASADDLRSAADWIEKTHPNDVRTAIARGRIRIEEQATEPPADAEQVPIEEEVLAAVNADLDRQRQARRHDG